jgi:hypothetical protein
MGAISTALVTYAAPASQSATPAGRSTLVQDPAWLARKLAHQIKRPGGISPACNNGCNGSGQLGTSVTQNTLEPYGSTPGTGNTVCTNDDAGYCYIDRNYWNFCGPGAAANALQYWGKNINTYAAGYYNEPSQSVYHTSQNTYWTSSDHNRSYLMYIAMQTDPPSFGNWPGLPNYSTYPTGGSTLIDMRDVLNWEASGHGTLGNWSTYFYARVSSSGLTSGTLNNDVSADIDSGAPVVAEVMTQDLPNWPSSKSLVHFVTIVGYDNVASTYTYVDSCGTACGANQQLQVYTINQVQMWHAIIDYNTYPGHNLTVNGGFDW